MIFDSLLQCPPKTDDINIKRALLRSSFPFEISNVTICMYNMPNRQVNSIEVIVSMHDQVTLNWLLAITWKSFSVLWQPCSLEVNIWKSIWKMILINRKTCVQITCRRNPHRDSVKESWSHSACLPAFISPFCLSLPAVRSVCVCVCLCTLVSWVFVGAVKQI